MKQNVEMQITPNEVKAKHWKLTRVQFNVWFMSFEQSVECEIDVERQIFVTVIFLTAVMFYDLGHIKVL